MKTIVVGVGVLFILFWSGCVQPAELSTQNLTPEEAKEIALASVCAREGIVKTNSYMYNGFTRTWWFDMALDKPGCNPACVVNDETRTAEINWRCTGLIEPQS